MGLSAFDGFNEKMLGEFMRINPDAATLFGLHDPYDRFLPHGGFNRYRETDELLAQWTATASELARKEELSLDQKLSLEVLGRWRGIYRFSLYEYPLWKMYPDALRSVFTILFQMLVNDYAPLADRLSAICQRINRIPVYLAQFRTRFSEERVVQEWVASAIESCERFPKFLESIREATKSVKNDTLASSLDNGIRLANEELVTHLSWLRDLRKKPNLQFAMGKARFEKLMKMRGFRSTPDQMLSLGERCIRELKEKRAKVAERLMPGGNADKVQKRIEDDHPETFEDALRIAGELMAEAKEFTIKNGITTVDEDATAVVLETPEFLRPVIPYAMCYAPTRFDKQKKGVYFLTRPGNPDDLGGFCNRVTLINTAVHEAFPGHFHQLALSTSKPWIFELPLAVRWADEGSILPFATESVEGWALYCEQMMLDHGYHESDELAFQILTDAVFRACRIVADIKLAYGEATTKEIAEWMAKETGMPLEGLATDAKVYSHFPGYFLSYMVGRQLIYALRGDLESKLGPRFDERMFHDLVAGYGVLPFCMVESVVRSQMMKLAESP
jgi:uncharacterized protein (DUF885 family)